VLGGAAARGVAHIGALQALEENGIYPQVIAGTSVGALIGGLYAAGVNTARMANLLPDLNWFDFVSLQTPTLNWGDLARTIPMGLVDLDKMIAWIEALIGEPVCFDQLNLAFAAIATDLLTGEVVVMNDGPLAPALRASCSVPGVFTPYRRNNRLLVDGVVVNNMPVRVAHDLGADYVIAVDLLPVLSSDGEANVANAEPRNVVEVAMTALFMLARATQIEEALADIVVTPAVAHFNLADLSVGNALMDAGYRAMSDAMPRILAGLGR
jgi:NTE family protein